MRRRFFLFAAPAIVAAPSLMKVSALVMPEPAIFTAIHRPWIRPSFSEIVTDTLRKNAGIIWETMERNRLIAAYLTRGESEKILTF